MQRTSLVIAAALAFSLAGCASTGSITPTNVASTIAQVQSTARTICSFVPTANTVANLLSVIGFGGFSGVTAMAAQICNAVINNPMTEGPGGGRTVPRVAGVPIRGKFVR